MVDSILMWPYWPPGVQICVCPITAGTDPAAFRAGGIRFRIWMADSTLPGSWCVVLQWIYAFDSLSANCMLGKAYFIPTCKSKSPPASGPTIGVVADSAGVTRQADGSDVVVECDRAAELHQRNIVVPECVLILWMDDNLDHVAL